jgi:LPXTG-motif cell wall-anchored protein
VVDVSECMPTDEPGDQPQGDQPQGDQPQADDDSSTEVLGSTTGRTALPHTGAGLALLSAAGLGLVAAGTVARKAARR